MEGATDAVKLAAYTAGVFVGASNENGEPTWEAVPAKGEMVPHHQRGVRAGRDDEWVLRHLGEQQAPQYILIEPIGKAAAVE